MKSHRIGKIVRQWEWEFSAPPSALWPLLADTARFNEAAGLPRYSVTDLPQLDGTVKRIGAVRRFGVTITWEEGVPQWVAGRRFAHERLFPSGPLRRVATEIGMNPKANGRTRVCYRLSIDTRGALSGLILRLGFIERFGHTLDRLFREAAEFAEGGRERGFTTPVPQIAPRVRQRVLAQAQALSERGYRATEKLAAHLFEASESDLERMRPRTLARRWGFEARQVIETCLAAARDGLLVLHWDLLCPRCGGAKVSVRGLDQLPRGAHCSSCNIDYTRDFSRNVEVTFAPDPSVRPIGAGTYCLVSPLASSHIRVQQAVAPRSVCEIVAGLTDGEYNARTVEAGGVTRFQVENGRAPELVLGDGGAIIIDSATGGHLRVRNEGSAPRHLVIEDRSWAKDALTAHEATTMQAFRDLFADAVLRPGDEVAIRRVTFLFTDIRGSSALYNRVGDARAYGWVREHYAVLTGAVRHHDGAVVKTIGDAVMAAFSEPVDAFDAALQIREEITEFDRSLAAETGEAGTIQVKIGLHCGPCIAVTLNDRLDYFGRTVNLAARLQGESRGDDIVLSQAMADDPSVAALLDNLAPTAEYAVVKGFAEPIGLRRIGSFESARLAG
jgi:class 3 adenylate cyclase